MGTKHSKTFGLQFENIALYNLREEFVTYYNLLLEDGFKQHLYSLEMPIETPYMDWYGTNYDLLSIMMQRAFSGIEAYIPGALYLEAGSRQMVSAEKLGRIHQPHNLSGRDNVDKYYHSLPQLVCEDWSLKVRDNKLWSSTKALYKEVRNPLFHGYQVDGKNYDGVIKVFGVIASLYEWIDTWHDYERLNQSSAEILQIAERLLKGKQ